MRCKESLSKHIPLFFSVVVYLLALTSNVLGQARQPNWIPGRVMVKFRFDEVELPEGKVQAAFANVTIKSASLKRALAPFRIARFAKVVPDAIKGDTLRTFPDGSQIKLTDFTQLFLLTFPKDIPVDSLLTALKEVEQVIYAEPDQTNISDEEPNDQFFQNGEQWHLKQTGQNNDEDIDAPEAWDLSKGDGIKIAIIDQGVRRSHQDFAGKIVGGETGVDPGSPNHGTKVAGTAAATTNNVVGVAGVAWKSKFMPYNHNRLLSQSIADINAAVSEGAHIINMSWHNTSYSQSLKDALDNAFALGATLVASAANIDSSPIVAYPHAFDGLVTAVSATKKNGSFLSGSNYGYFVDVAAPGQFIRTTNGDNDADYASPSGTSFSAPIVSGITALLRSFKTSLIDRDFERVIELSAVKTNQNTFAYDANGWNDHMGHGRVNAHQALDLANDNEFFHWTASGGTATQMLNNFPVWFFDLPGAPNGYYVGNRYEVTKTVTFPQTFTSTPQVWGRVNGTVGYNPSPSNTNFSIAWCDAISVSPTSAVLRTFVYEVARINGLFYGWYPTTPLNVVFAYTVMGTPGAPPPTPPPAPTSLVVTNAGQVGQNPNLSWITSSGATFYKVYRRVSFEPTWMLMGSTSSTSYTDNTLTIKAPNDPMAEEFLYQVTAVNDVGESWPSNSASVWGFSFFRERGEQVTNVPRQFRLGQNHPNPFNPTTTIRYALPEVSNVSLIIYDMSGRKVRSFTLRYEPAGYKQAVWDGTDEEGNLAPTGIYIYRLMAKSLDSDEGIVQSRKMALIR